MSASEPLLPFSDIRDLANAVIADASKGFSRGGTVPPAWQKPAKLARRVLEMLDGAKQPNDAMQIPEDLHPTQAQVDAAAKAIREAIVPMDLHTSYIAASRALEAAFGSAEQSLGEEPK